MAHSQLDDTVEETGRVLSLTPSLRSGRLRVESVEPSLPFAEHLFPAEQGRPRYLERVPGSLQSVRSPKVERFCTSSHLLLVSHMQEAYSPLPHTQPARGASKYVELPHDSLC